MARRHGWNQKRVRQLRYLALSRHIAPPDLSVRGWVTFGCDLLALEGGHRCGVTSLALLAMEVMEATETWSRETRGSLLVRTSGDVADVGEDFLEDFVDN